MSTSFRLREQGNALFKSVNSCLSPVLRESRLKEALSFYNKALSEADCDLEKSCACKNIMVASDSLLK